MVNVADIQTREDFVKIINDLGLKTGIEIGLGRGHNAVHLLENSSLDILYSVDNWSVRHYRRDKKATMKKFDKYGDRFVMLEMGSIEASKQFEDEFFDFIYIDGNHHKTPCYNDLVAYYPKVREGGFFGGHDYVRTKKCGVIPAVDSFFNEIGREFNLTCEPNEDNLNKSYWILK